QRVQLLNDMEKSSGPWSLWHLHMRFGLYSVGDMSSRVREAYFSRLKTSLLDLAQSNLISFLRSLRPSTDPGVIRTDRERLKAYLMTKSSDSYKCTPEAAVVFAGLTAMVPRAGLTEYDPRLPLVEKQIKFYADELKSGNPVQLTEDPDAQKHALLNLSSLSDFENRYQSVIDSVAAEKG